MSNISFNPLAWAIKPMYDKAIAEDAIFAKEVKEKESRAEKPKSLSECAEYILGEAFDWASNHRDGMVGYAGLPDDEVVNLIKHYYDEENIEIKKVTNATAKVATSKEKTPAKVEKPKEEPKTKGNIVKMEIPLTAKQEKRQNLLLKQIEESRAKSAEQAKKESTMDMFAGMFGVDKEEPKKIVPPAVPVKKGEIEVVDVDDLPADDDDLPL